MEDKFKIYFEPNEDEPGWMSEPVTFLDLLHANDMEFRDKKDTVSLPLNDFRFYYKPNEKYHILKYTYLKDMKGNEIYEGDILKLNEIGRKLFGGINGPLDREYQLVGFFDGGFMTGHNHLDPEIMNTYLWIIRDYVEVVGNKYQNPELLEKDKDYYINWLKENENDEFISHI